MGVMGMILKAKKFYAIIISLFVFFSGMLISADTVNANKDKIALPIIMYHHISDKKYE